MPKDNLIEKALNGNQKAYKELFDKYVNDLYRYLRQFSNNRDQVEDWVQRAFIKAFRNLNSFRGDSGFCTWLFKIGINEMRTDLRSIANKKHEEYEENLCADNFVDEVQLEWHDEMKWLLKGLDETKKNIFILYEVEGYKHSEIADILNISEALSKTSLHRTKKILKGKLLKNGVGNDREKSILLQ